MKKILFGTTALLAASAFVSTAQASDPIKLSVGGYMEWWVAAADQSSDYAPAAPAKGVNNVDVQSDAEVFFKGKTTLDNGMTIGADIQLEASSSAKGDPIDEAYLYISGKYGKMIVGAENSAAYLMNVSAPGVSILGIVGKESDVKKLLPKGKVKSLEVIPGSIIGDAPKVTYFTPRMYGFQLGASYIPGGDSNGDEDDSSVAISGSWDEAWSVGLSYANKFDGVGIKASTTYELIDDNNVSAVDNEIQRFGAGLNLSYEGFTVGGGVLRQVSNYATSQAATDGTAWNVGLSYKEGPYGVSAAYYNSSVEGDRTVKSKDKVTQYQLAGTYALGAGVTMFAEVDYMDADKEAVATDGNEGAIGGALGLKLKF